MLDNFKGFFRELGIDGSKARDTGLAMVLLLLILSWWQDSLIYSQIGLVVLVITMVVPRVFLPLAYVWFGFAVLLGSFVSRILLFVVFNLVVLPVGMIRKLAGKDPLKLKEWKAGSASVFRTRDHSYSASDIDKPY